ncbi:MAG TPA: HEAT repeat domain-containing protein [Vicinamibacterales bacterium]|nr:HEAT repeat domain-containing protein [Vicinamibacterales bacterium]HPW20247.1 HEAT repeat domain-containing protein [Vicinamibacterales bacterium]
MIRAGARALALVALTAAHAAAQTPGAGPTFDEKMAWMIRLEDQRILRAPEPPPAAPAPQPKRRLWQRRPPPPPAAVPDLLALLRDPEGRVRRRAAQAVGRVGLPEGAAPLAAVLASDADAEVRQMAAFALGLIRDRSSVGPLRAALDDPSPLVRGRAAESLGLLGDAGSAPAIAAMASAVLAAGGLAGVADDDVSAGVPPLADAFRLAVVALARLKAADDLLGVVLGSSGGLRVRWWPAAFALSRIDDARAEPALEAIARDGGSVSKAFAARGLGARRARSAVAALVRLVEARTAEPRAAVSAVRALGQIGDAQAAPALRSLLRDQDVDSNLKLEAIAALGALKDGPSLDTLVDLVGDAWPAARAAALRAIREIDAETYLVVLSGLDADPHPSVRRAIVAALPSLGAEVAVPRLSALLAGEDVQVLPAAIEAAASLEARPPGFGEVLLRLLGHADVMVRAAAASAIGAVKPEGGDRALASAYRAAAGDGLYQARVAALSALAKYGAGAALPVLRDALGDRDWAVRLSAAALLRAVEPASDTASRIRPAPGRGDAVDYAAPALVAPAVSPHVFLDTDAGTVEIELAVLDAPLTSASFLALARSGYFSGMAIHRVVPDFVVQAGDPRGDGEGGPGYTLRDEINMLPYLRGTVGMALDGPDTGGSQFFITHSPQPHLDAKYTVFGRVVAGMDAVDRLRQWDVIRRVRVWDGVELVTR